MFDADVTGGEALWTLRQTCKSIDATLWKELAAGMRQAGKPAVRAAKRSALETLPKSGGLAAIVAKSRFTVATRTGRQTAGVVVRGSSKHAIRSMDRGRLRHPLFGNREYWYAQPVDPGWFSDAMDDSVGEFRDAVEDVMETFAARLEEAAG